MPGGVEGNSVKERKNRHRNTRLGCAVCTKQRGDEKRKQGDTDSEVAPAIGEVGSEAGPERAVFHDVA